jgi:hypothetical protein
MIKIRCSQFQVSILKQMFVRDCDNPKQSKKKKSFIESVSQPIQHRCLKWGKIK